MPRIEVPGDDHLSYSQLNEFSMCPRRYYYNRIEKLKMRPAWPLVAGKAVHEGLEEHNRERMKGRKGLLPSEMLEVAVMSIEQREDVSEMEMSVDEAKDRLTKEAVPPLATYTGYTEQEIGDDVVDVEKRLDFEFAGEKFVGYIDVEFGESLVDYKFTARRKSKKDIEVDPQLILYSEVVEKPGAFVTLLKKKEVAEYDEQNPSKRVRHGVLTWLRDMVRAIKRAKKSGDFRQTDPRNWQCGETCPFYYKCFGRS